MTLNVRKVSFLKCQICRCLQHTLTRSALQSDIKPYIYRNKFKFIFRCSNWHIVLRWPYLSLSPQHLYRMFPLQKSIFCIFSFYFHILFSKPMVFEHIPRTVGHQLTTRRHALQSNSTRYYVEVITLLQLDIFIYMAIYVTFQ